MGILMSTDAPDLLIPIRLQHDSVKGDLQDLERTLKQHGANTAREQKAGADTATQARKQEAAETIRINKEVNSLLKELARDETRIAKEAQKEAIKAAREKAEAEREAYRDAVRAAREASRIEVAEARRARREIQEKAKEQDKADKAYLRAVRMKLRAEKELEKQQRKEQEATNASISATAKMTAGLISLGAAGRSLSTIVEHFDKIRADALQAAESVMKMRGAVRELQALRDQMGQTGPGIGHTFDIARQTLQTPEEVRAMESAGLGVGELALKNDKDRAEFTKAMVAAGRFQQIEGGDAGAYGQMMGQIALQSKGPINAADMEAQAWRLFQIQKPGGFHTMSQAMGQYSRLNGLVQNGIYSPEEAMGLASAFSVANPEDAATRVEQFTRAVMSGRIKARGMHVAEGVDFQKTNQYFKELGIGENDSAIARGKKIAEDLARQQKAKGKNFNSYEYLMRRGFGNQEDREVIMAISGLRNTGKLEKIEAAQNAQLERGAISKQFAERVSHDNFLKGRAAELSEQAATTKQGLEEEPLVLAQRTAFARLKSQGKISGTFDEWRNAGWLKRGTENLMGGYHHQVDAEASRVLAAERKRLGLPQYSGFQWSEYETMKRSAREVQQAGGDVTRGVDDDLRSAAKDIREASREYREVTRQRNNKPMVIHQPPGRHR